MKRYAFTVVLIVFFSAGFTNISSGQITSPSVSTDFGFEQYHERTEFLLTPPGAMKSGLYGYDNPAMLQFLHQPDVAFYWTSDKLLGDSPRQGAFMGFPGVSFSFVRNNFEDRQFRDYRIAVGGGMEAAAGGIALNWYGGDTDLMDLKSHLTIGTITRPTPHISFGLTGTSTFNAENYELVADLAVRPTGTPILTLFGDYAINEKTSGPIHGRWSAGAVAEVLPGIRFTGRYLEGLGITAGLQFSFGDFGIGYQSHMDNRGNYRYNSYSIRAGARDRNIFDRYFKKDQNYVNMEIGGSLPYQSYRFFDERATFLTTLDQIHEAADDPSVSGIVINTTRMQTDPVKTWEIRTSLQEFRQTGKRVIVYIERGGMNTLHLTSAADYVVVDPMGGLTIPGYVSGATYMADLLASVGIGVDEFREMEYKSAYEPLSRTGMSEADREQRRDIIDDFYELVKNDVTKNRFLDGDEYDTLIDRGIALSAQDLVDNGIADTLARYTSLSDIIEKLENEKKRIIGADELYTYQKPGDEIWGPEHKIAVFYAEGPAMIGTGIRARLLLTAIREARNDPLVKAVVMRADSPGGDALASDLVAEELRRTAQDKPVIVSMGSVAASGGYWISMHADTIVAAPNTLTGSIGVISGWLWDDGLSNHLRLHSDHVSRGESADLLFGPTLPLIGLTLPNRALTEVERENLINRMHSLYEEFIEKAASGRDLKPDAIEQVAAGRVWTGVDAQKHRLIDQLGSLYTAIGIAKEQAGLGPSDAIKIVEGPDALPFSLSLLMRRVLGSDAPAVEQSDPAAQYVELMIEHNATPLVIMPFEYFSWMYYLKDN